MFCGFIIVINHLNETFCHCDYMLALNAVPIQLEQMVIIKVGVMELITSQLGMDLEDVGVSEVEDAVNQLVQLCNRLQTENAALRAREEALTKERDDLLERNETVKVRVESIINRLKDMEHED